MGGVFDIASKDARAAELDELTVVNEFWNDQEKAQAVLKERASLTEILAQWKKHLKGIEDAQMFLEMAEAGDEEAAVEFDNQVEELEKEVRQAEMQRMLGEEHDPGNAIVSLHPGAGGLEAQDWAEMLLRMYLRWAERKGYKVEMADYQPGEGGRQKRYFHSRRPVRLWLHQSRSWDSSPCAHFSV